MLSKVYGYKNSYLGAKHLRVNDFLYKMKLSFRSFLSSFRLNIQCPVCNVKPEFQTAVQELVSHFKINLFCIPIILHGLKRHVNACDQANVAG